MSIFFQNPSHAKIPEIEGTSRIPQTNSIRTAKPSKIAKPSGLGGTKLSTLPKSLSNEKICQASNLVQKTTKSLFNRNRFGKPPEPKPRAIMDSQPKDSTFAIARPTLTRSGTFDKIETNASKNEDTGNNLTQNVISKLQEQTFTTSNPVRMSISPIAPSHQFAEPRPVTDSNFKVPAAYISSTPFRSTPSNVFSTKQLHTRSMDISGTDSPAVLQVVDSANVVDATEPSILPIANSLPSDTPVSGSTHLGMNKQLSWPTEFISPINCSENLADISEPSFLNLCTPIVQQTPSREKFHQLAEKIKEETLIADTTSNFCTSVMNNTEEDESTIKNATMTLSQGDDDSGTTLISQVPVDGEVMEIDDRGSTASCGGYQILIFFF